jgi:hypothetical protein
MHPISVANSGKGGRNLWRHGGGDLVARAQAEEEDEGRHEPTCWFGFDQARLVRSSPVGFRTGQVGPEERNW